MKNLALAIIVAASTAILAAWSAVSLAQGMNLANQFYEGCYETCSASSVSTGSPNEAQQGLCREYCGCGLKYVQRNLGRQALIEFVKLGFGRPMGVSGNQALQSAQVFCAAQVFPSTKRNDEHENTVPQTIKQSCLEYVARSAGTALENDAFCDCMDREIQRAGVTSADRRALIENYSNSAISELWSRYPAMDQYAGICYR